MGRISAATTSINRTVSRSSDSSNGQPEGTGLRMLLLARPAAVQEDASLRKSAEDQLGRRRAIDVGHVAVEQHDFRRETERELHCLATTGGLAHDLQAWHDPEKSTPRSRRNTRRRASSSSSANTTRTSCDTRSVNLPDDHPAHTYSNQAWPSASRSSCPCAGSPSRRVSARRTVASATRWCGRRPGAPLSQWRRDDEHSGRARRSRQLARSDPACVTLRRSKQS